MTSTTVLLRRLALRPVLPLVQVVLARQDRLRRALLLLLLALLPPTQVLLLLRTLLHRPLPLRTLLRPLLLRTLLHPLPQDREITGDILVFIIMLRNSTT